MGLEVPANGLDDGLEGGGGREVGVEDGARAAFEGHLVRADQHGEGGGAAGLVLATCHDDFVPWLQPDWVFSTQTMYWYNFLFRTAFTFWLKPRAPTILSISPLS